jgi:hypothetical protein
LPGLPAGHRDGGTAYIDPWAHGDEAFSPRTYWLQAGKHASLIFVVLGRIIITAFGRFGRGDKRSMCERDEIAAGHQRGTSLAFTTQRR